MSNEIENALSENDPKFRITPFQQMAAACSGALITSFMVTPLDVVKIRLQAQQKSPAKCFLYCNGLMDHLCPCIPETYSNGTPPASGQWYHRPGQFNGTIDALVKITKSEGILSLWSGLSPTLVLAIPSTVVYFVTYEQLRVKMYDKFLAFNRSRGVPDGQSPQPFWVPMLAGATARTWAATLVSPLELIRTKMQSKKLSYLEMLDALKSLLHYHGVTGLWKGLGSTLLRDVPFSALYWVNYETFKKVLLPKDSKNPGVMVSFFGGAFSGSLAAFITTPFDVAKTHQQIEIGETEIYKGKRISWKIPNFIYRLVLNPAQEPPGKAKSTTFSVLRKVHKQHGLAGVFAGLTPRLVKVAPACAIMVASFEYGKTFFENYNKNLHMNVNR